MVGIEENHILHEQDKIIFPPCYQILLQEGWDYDQTQTYWPAALNLTLEDACDAKRPLYSFFQPLMQTDFPGIIIIVFAIFDMQTAHGTSLLYKLFPNTLSSYSEP